MSNLRKFLLGLLLLAAAGSAFAAGVFKEEYEASYVNTGVAKTMVNPVSVGDTIILFIYTSGDTAQSTATMTGATGTFTSAKYINYGATFISAQIAQVTGAGTPTITVNTTPANCAGCLYWEAFSFSGLTGAVNASGSTGGNASTTLTASSTTTASTTVFGVWANYTQGNKFSAFVGNPVLYTNNSSFAYSSGYKTGVAAGTYSDGVTVITVAVDNSVVNLYLTESAGSSSISSFDGLANASVSSLDGTAAASIASKDGLAK